MPRNKRLDTLNLIWVGFFAVAFVVALIKSLWGDHEVFPKILESMFSLSKTGFEIALGLTGIMALWMGIMKIGEAAGLMHYLTKALTPFFRKIFPEVPHDHPALGAISMNMAANILGLDNAATPVGLKAMSELQSLNPKKDTASNAQIMFLVINTSSVTLFPIAIFTFRAQQGAANPTDVFIPILMATFVSTLVGFLTVAKVQKIRILDPIILSYLGGLSLLVAGVGAYFSSLSTSQIEIQSNWLSSFLLVTLVTSFIVFAWYKNLHVYEHFIEGAKEGFKVSVSIIPHLVAMLVAIAVFRACGAMEAIFDATRFVLTQFGMDTRFVEALPTAMMKPLSGSGARGMMIDAMQTYGADSFVGRMASVMQGSTETTFYVLAVYFGSVGIRKYRYAVSCGLTADLAGVIAAILVSYLYFG